jgi:hypothetical protein
MLSFSIFSSADPLLLLGRDRAFLSVITFAMVVIGVDDVLGILGFFSHLIRAGLELFTMTRDALMISVDNSNIILTWMGCF